MESECIAAAPDILFVQQTQLPAVVRIGTLCLDRSQNRIHFTAFVDRQTLVDKVLTNRCSRVGDQTCCWIDDCCVIVFKEGIAEFARTSFYTIKATASTVQIDKLQIEHVDVRTVVVTLTNPRYTTIQEINVFCFNVCFRQFQCGITKVRIWAVSIGPQCAGKCDAINRFGEGGGIATLKVGITFVTEAVFHCVTTEAKAALWSASRTDACAVAQIPVETIFIVAGISMCESGRERECKRQRQCFECSASHFVSVIVE